jgi:hypothetical protein
MLKDELNRARVALEFIIHHSAFIIRSRPRGAAWSARLPVTQDDHATHGARGPNPVEGAFDRHGAVRKSAKRPSSNLGDCGFDSRLRHLRTCVGWASVSPTACKAAAFGMCRFNSCPAHSRYGPFVYRQRTPAPHAGKAGSIPARAAEEHDQVAQLVDARRSERRAARHGSSTLPLVTWDLRLLISDFRLSTEANQTRKSEIINPKSEIRRGWASAHSGLISLDDHRATPGGARCDPRTRHDRVRKLA